MKKFAFLKTAPLLIGMILLLTCCGTQNQPSPDVAETQPEYKKITPEEAQAMMSGDVVILDVRTQEEFDEGHIENAVLLPFDEIKDNAESVIPDKNQTVLVYCKTGGRSEHASRELVEMGYTNVFDFGGINGWTGEVVGYWLYDPYYNYFGDPLPEDIITPIEFTTTMKVNEQMPAFTSTLTGNNVKSYGLNYDKDKYYMWRDDNEIRHITITDENGMIIQEMDLGIASESGSGSEIPAWEEDMGIAFEDWNFDGYLDISLYRYRGGSMGNSPHYYWLWDNNLEQFVENMDLEEISGYSTIEPDPDTQLIGGFTNYGAGGYGTCSYKYENGGFILIRSTEWLEEPSTDDENKWVTRVIVEELIDGEMVVTQDYYEEN